MCFDGALLHGAPHGLIPVRSHAQDQLDRYNSNGSAERITFLANIWLNYHPAGLWLL